MKSNSAPRGHQVELVEHHAHGGDVGLIEDRSADAGPADNAQIEAEQREGKERAHLPEERNSQTGVEADF